jgi:gamma-glutamyltranspeptidase/glutathione hydrolase
MPARIRFALVSCLTFWTAAALCAAAVLAATPAPPTGTRAMVVSPKAEATLAGLAMLEAGGNAVDAAIAAAFAMGVVQPHSNGIGGGDFILIRMADGRTVALDARETAPAAATEDLYTRAGVPERASLVGGLASGTPGSVAGRALALQEYGTLPLAQVMEPAIRLAAEGYPIGPYQARMIERVRGFLPPGAFPEIAVLYLPEGAGPDDILVQADLATTLRTIAENGPRAFYQGKLAQAMASAARAAGGILTTADLAAYRPVEREPLRSSWRGYEILSFPPPSSGGTTLIEILNIVEGDDLRAMGAGSSAAIHRLAEAMKLAFADRAVHLGDPDFADIPVATLVDKAYAARLRGLMEPPWWRRAPWHWFAGERALHVPGPGFAPDDQGTAHLSVVDGAGNAVAITSTINGPFGALVLVPGTGILLNNQMDDFVTEPGRANTYGLLGVAGANLVGAGKRPLSSMAPTIVLADGRVRFVAGSNGGPVIITSTLLSLVNDLVYGMDVLGAVSAPRFHHQWSPDVLRLEAAHPADVRQGLLRRGHELKIVDTLTSGVQAVAVDPESGVLTGGADPRRDSFAAGL